MIRVRDAKLFRRTKDRQILIDLKGMVDQKDILVCIARKLSTTYSETVDGTSMDYFVDVISDWMRENLPNPPRVIIVGFRESKNTNGGYLAGIVACMHQAMLMALSQRFQNKSDFDFIKELRAFHIDFYI